MCKVCLLSNNASMGFVTQRKRAVVLSGSGELLLLRSNTIAGIRQLRLHAVGGSQAGHIPPTPPFVLCMASSHPPFKAAMRISLCWSQGREV